MITPEEREQILDKFREEIKTESGVISDWNAKAILSAILNAMTDEPKNELDRYQIAGEVLEEWNEFEDSIYALDFVLWLDQQESKE